MTGSTRSHGQPSALALLCITEDARLLDDLARPFEDAYSRVLRATVPETVETMLRHHDVGTLVCSDRTLMRAPRLLGAARDQFPALSLYVVSTQESGGDIAISEVVDFVDAPGAGETRQALATWLETTHEPSRSDRGVDRMVEDVRRRLATADSPMDVQATVRETLTHGGRYQFAWIGEFDRGERHVVPWVTATPIDGWPTHRSFPVSGDGTSVIERTLRTRAVQVVDDIPAAADRVPWADAAIEWDSTAVATLPLTGDGRLHGVMGLYTDSTGGFADRELRALEEIGAVLSHVLETIAIRGRADQQERVLDRYERLVETAGDGMYVVGPDGHVRTVNDRLLEMTGYTREGLLGEHVSTILADDGDGQRSDPGDGIRRGDDREPRTTAVDLERKDGSVLPCEAKIAPLEREHTQGSVGVVRDVSDRLQRERELERQNQRLEAFATMVSHDLRNPLGVAQGYLERVRADGDDAALGKIAGSLERMEEIVDDVLALAREGQTVTEPEPVDVATVAREAWETVETPRAGFAVRNSATVAVDPARFRRALENLFRNAVEHGIPEDAPGADTPGDPDYDGAVASQSASRSGSLEAGRRPSADPAAHSGPDTAVSVVVGVEPESEHAVTVYVADDGVGLPADADGDLFDSGVSGDPDGLGIGLWAVREIASAHGWEPRATHSDYGGARFEFRGVESA